MTQTAQEVRTVTIAGRGIDVTKVGETQAMLLFREGSRLKRPGVTFDQVATSSDRVLTVLESHVVKAEDWEFLTDEMITGRLDINDLLVIVKAFKDDGAATAAPAKPAVRRGRPPKNRG